MGSLPLPSISHSQPGPRPTARDEDLREFPKSIATPPKEATSPITSPLSSPTDARSPLGSSCAKENMAHLHKLVEQERAKYDRELRGRQYVQDFLDLEHSLPAPVPATRPKKKPSSLPALARPVSQRRRSLRQNGRGSRNIVVEELSAIPPRRKILHRTPTSPMYSMESEFLSFPYEIGSSGSEEKVKRKKSGELKTPPPRTPFPFSPIRSPGPKRGNTSSSVTLRISDAMRHFKKDKGSSSGLGSNLMSKPKRSLTVPDMGIQREIEGIETPTSSTSQKLGFKAYLPSPQTIQKMDQHIQDAIAKAKMSSDERRREKLKKKIVVVGITDQNPGW